MNKIRSPLVKINEEAWLFAVKIPHFFNDIDVILRHKHNNPGYF